MTKCFTPVEIAAQRAIKRAFDPTGLLNPSITLPDTSLDEPHLDEFEAALRSALRRRPTVTAAAPATTTGGSQIAVNTANLSLVVGEAVTLNELSRHLTERGGAAQRSRRRPHSAPSATSSQTPAAMSVVPCATTCSAWRSSSLKAKHQ